MRHRIDPQVRGPSPSRARRRLVRVALCVFGGPAAGVIGLVVLVHVFRNRLVVLDD